MKGALFVCKQEFLKSTGNTGCQCQCDSKHTEIYNQYLKGCLLFIFLIIEGEDCVSN